MINPIKVPNDHHHVFGSRSSLLPFETLLQVIGKTHSPKSRNYPSWHDLPRLEISLTHTSRHESTRPTRQHVPFILMLSANENATANQKASAEQTSAQRGLASLFEVSYCAPKDTEAA